MQRLAANFPVVAVLGARQVGKSTLLDRAFGQIAPAVVFDPVVDVANARQDPELFLRMRGTPLILDEIQYAPELLPALKRAVDQRRGEPGQYFLTGSQQLPVLRGVQESLAGRVALLDLLPMSRRELHQAAGPSLLQVLLGGGLRTARQLHSELAALPRVATGAGLLQQLYRGGFPGLLPLGDDDVAEWMGSYLRTYVERDIRPLRDVGQPHEFTRFLRLMAALTGQELNASQLGRDIGIAPKTALAWLEVLERSFQILPLPA
ncbi:MAG: ATP-binding protein, partial [Deltaproteobacteria bacterium]|nr:ATP-binding protein [Deltaproteobacteria bacterium]